MTLKSKIFLMLSVFGLFANSASAYITPGGPRPAPYDPRPAPYPGGPVRPEPAPYPQPPYPQPPYEDSGISVSLNVYTSLSSSDRLDLTQYIDMYRYEGYRIDRIDIDAQAMYQTAFINVIINGFNAGNNLQVDDYNRTVSAYPNDMVIGQGATSIVLYTQGNMTITGVTLQLSRY